MITNTRIYNFLNLFFQIKIINTTKNTKNTKPEISFNTTNIYIYMRKKGVKATFAASF